MARYMIVSILVPLFISIRHLAQKWYRLTKQCVSKLLQLGWGLGIYLCPY